MMHCLLPVLLLVGATPASTPPPAAQLVQSSRWVMGTTLRIAVVGNSPDSLNAALTAAFDEVQRWNDLLSNYQPESALSQVNAHAGRWVDVPEDVFVYFERSVEDADKTSRAFDITVGGWLAAEEDAKPVVGIQWLQLRQQGQVFQVRLRQAGMAVDPGGNGKGVALDAAAGVLRSLGVRDALLDFGGSSWVAMGTPPEGLTWDIEIAGPRGEPVGAMRLVDRALSVSSSLRTDLAAGDEPMSKPTPHIVDPQKLTWVTEDRVVIVVSPSAADAEVLSTALVVRGEPGLPMLSRYPEAGAVLLQVDADPIVTLGAEIWFRPR